MATIKGKAILSINDHPEIRGIFRNVRLETTEINYTVGKERGKKSGELIVRSW